LFLNYIVEKAKVLKTLCIVRSEIDDVAAVAVAAKAAGHVVSAATVGQVAAAAAVGNVVPDVGPMSGFILERDAPSGGSSGSVSVCPASRSWSFQHAIDLSVKDPFYVARHDVPWISCRTEDETVR
jgi:hypothetical protein